MTAEPDYVGMLLPSLSSHPAVSSGPQREKRGRRETADRFAMLNAFVDFTLAKLDGAAIGVWLVLYRDSRDGIARTGQTDIARRCGVCVRTVKRAIARLAGRGLVEVARRGNLRSGPSAYRVKALANESVGVT